MRWALAVAVAMFTALPARAQETCEVRCNQQASECLKACTGDPKDAQKPEASQRLLECIKQCEAKTKACKGACGPKKP
ncbi:MAG: hypothetical protein AMXMBFR34_23440 [Myxococcaceae bacterium]